MKIGGSVTDIEFIEEYAKKAVRLGIGALIFDNYRQKTPESAYGIHIKDYEIMVGQLFEVKEYPRFRIWYERSSDRAGVEASRESVRSLFGSKTFVEEVFRLVETGKLPINKIKEVFSNNHKSEEKIPEINKV